MDHRPQSVRRFLAPRVDCGYVADQAAAFALGALEPAERVNVERHIRSCVSCASIVADLEETAGLLPFAAPPAVPTAAAKTALFARIANAERASMPQVQAQAQPRPLARPAHAAPLPTMLTIPASGLSRRGAAAPTSFHASPKRPVSPVVSQTKRWFAVGAPLATIPLVLALALVSVWSLSLLDRVQTGSEQVDVLNERLNTGRSVITGAEVDTGDGGVESVLGIDGLVDEALLGAAAVEAEADLDLDANADLLGFVYGGVDVGETSATTVDTLQYGDQLFPTGGEVAIG